MKEVKYVAKYIKKPIPVEAWKLTYVSAKNKYPKFIQKGIDDKKITIYIDDESKEAVASLETILSPIFIGEGTYIVQGPFKDFYPVDEKIFEETYTLYKPKK